MENIEKESQLVDDEDSCLMLASNIREINNLAVFVEGEDSCPMLVRYIRGMLETVGPPLSSKRCIYWVHNTLRKLNEASYTPKLVSIGPFHYGKVEFETMERYKIVCLQKILGRDGVSRSLEEFLIYIKQQEQRVRDCYAESIELSSDEFVMMILLDASFILEVWSRYFVELEPVKDEIYYDILSTPWMTTCIRYDLRLLENQLPFFVLEGLYDLFFPSNRYNHRPSFFSLVRRRLHFNNQEISPKARVQDIKHFTDFIRTSMQPSSPRLEPKKGKSGRLSYSAVELHQAGVKFKVSSNKCLFDIKFSNGVLHIPNLIFVDETESSLRNLMALEQCHYPLREIYICDYVMLMDALINSSKDVDLLVKNGIISNHLGLNDAVTTIINNLGIEIVHGDDKSYFCRLCQDLTEYYENPWHRWKATLKQDYFSTPWRIVSIAAAIMLLGLTFIQTVNSFGKH